MKQLVPLLLALLALCLAIHYGESKMQAAELLTALQASLQASVVPPLIQQLPIRNNARSLYPQTAASDSTSAGWIVANAYYGSTCGTGIGVFSAGSVVNVCTEITSDSIATSVIITCDSSTVTATVYASTNCTGNVISSNSTDSMCAILPTEFSIDDQVITVPQMSVSWMCVDSPTVQLGADYALSLLSESSTCVPSSQYAGVENMACLAFSSDGLQLSAKVDYPEMLVYFGSTCQGFAISTLEIPNPGQCVETEDLYSYYAYADDGLIMPYQEYTLASAVSYALPTPTAIPSPAPTRTPTVVNTPRPTAPLSTAESLQYSVLQVLEQVDVDSYTADLSLNNQVVAEAVASCMDGVTSDEISVSTVSAASNTSAASRRLQSSTASTLVNYTVAIPNTAVAGYTSAEEAYNATTADLQDALRTGVFTSTLRDCAFSLGAPALQNASSTTATTSSAQVGPAVDDDSDDGSGGGSSVHMGAGAVAGVTVGLLGAVAMVATGAFLYRKASVLTTEVNAIEMGTPASAVVINPMATAPPEEEGGGNVVVAQAHVCVTAEAAVMQGPPATAVPDSAV